MRTVAIKFGIIIDRSINEIIKDTSKNNNALAIAETIASFYITFKDESSAFKFLREVIVNLNQSGIPPEVYLWEM